MEKRTGDRNQTELPIDCRPLTTSSRTGKIAAVMLNYSSRGTCIKSAMGFAKGAILLIRIVKYPSQSSHEFIANSVRSISLAEVRWVIPMEEDGEHYFGIGLKYLR